MLAFRTFLIWKKISHTVRRALKGKHNLHKQNYSFSIESLPKKLPRIVWIFWDKPIESAPAFVQYAVRSWIEKNPGWEVRVITDQTLDMWAKIPVPKDGRKIQGRSDAIRLALLSRYGGAWVDATCVCVIPLEHWLPPLMQSGFFAFPDTYPGREMQSWFLASSPANYLVKKWHDLAIQYYGKNGKIGHYFWVMHLFEFVVRTDRRASHIWKTTPKISGKGSVLLKRILTEPDLGQIIPEFIDLNSIPMHKISSSTRTDAPEVVEAMAQQRDIDLRKVLGPLWESRNSLQG